MKKYLLILILFTNCNQYNPEWSIAPFTYKCTDDEMKKVMDQTEWCNKNTDYNGQYCFGTALIRNCTKIQNNKQLTFDIKDKELIYNENN